MLRLPPAGSDPVSAGQTTGASSGHARARSQGADEGVRPRAQVPPPCGALHRQVRYYD